VGEVGISGGSRNGDGSTCFCYALGLFFTLDFLEIKPDESSKGTVIDKFTIHNSYYGRKVLRGKAWRKEHFSKSGRKLSRRQAIFSVGHESMTPTIQQKNSKFAKQDEAQDFFEILIRLERKIDSAQESILENETRMLARLSITEEEIEKYKVDIADLKTKQSYLESKVKAMADDISFNHDHY